MAVSGSITQPISLARVTGASGGDTEWGEEGASQTFLAGAPLIRSSSYLVEASADPTANIVGIAAEDGHNDSSAGTSNVAFYPALQSYVFEATLEDQTNEDHALVITNIWTDYALQVDPGGDTHWYIDENDTSATSVIIVGYRDALATVRARVYFRFLNDVTVYST